MDSLRLAIALGPLAVYLLALALLNLSRRATLVTGTRDTLAMGIAVSGLVLAGPLELFMPMDAANFFGPLVWLLLIAFYTLILTFVVLAERPRLVIYNAPVEVVRPVTAKLAAALDPEARWAGDSLAMPALNVELRLETGGPFRSVVLIANYERQSFAGWKLLEVNLRRELASVPMTRNWPGLALLLAAFAMMGFVLYGAASDPNGVAQSLVQMLRL